MDLREFKFVVEDPADAGRIFNIFDETYESENEQDYHRPITQASIILTPQKNTTFWTVTFTSTPDLQTEFVKILNENQHMRAWDFELAQHTFAESARFNFDSVWEKLKPYNKKESAAMV